MRTRLNKTIYTAIMLLLAISLISAGVASKTQRVKFGEDASFHSGRAGVVFSRSQYDGFVSLKRTGSHLPGENKPLFVEKALDVRLTDLNDERVTHVTGAVYVYFQVRRAQVKQFENGQLSIYFYDTWPQKWVRCDTFAVYNGDGVTSLACRISVFGLYGLAEK